MNGIMRARGRMLRRAAMTLVGVVVFAGCEGSNLFEGEVAEQGPTVSSLAVPSSAVSGEEFNVDVTATAPRGVRFIDIVVSGAATGDLREEFPGDSEVETVLLSVSGNASAGSQVFIDAYVQDMNGTNSPTRRATVNITAAGTSSIVLH